MEDPFYLVRDDVVKALAKLRGLYQRRSELEAVPATAAERTWTDSELCNALRSIEWDVEDLQETIDIVERNQKQFKLSAADLQARRSFVKATRDELQALKERMSLNRATDSDRTARQPLLEQPPASPEQPGGAGSASGGGYSRLREDEPDSPEHQRYLAEQQRRHLDGSGGDLSQRLGEPDDQTIIIDDIIHEVQSPQGKLGSRISKLLNVMRLSNERRQWTAIGVLSGIMFVVVIMFFFV